MIVTDGGRFGGYGLYLLKGKPVCTYNLLALEKARDGREMRRSLQASIPSSSISPQRAGCPSSAASGSMAMRT